MGGIAVVIAGAALLLLRTAAMERWLGLALVGAVELASGERASVGGVHVEPIRRQLRVHGLILSSREGGDTILAVREVVVGFGRQGVKPTIEQVQVKGPVLNLHLDPDGLREFRDAVKTEGGGGTPWQELQVLDAQLTLHTEQGRVTVKDLDLEPDGRPHGCTLSVARLEVQRGSFQQASEPLHWEGLTVELSRLVVPELSLGFPLGSASGQLDLQRKGPLEGSIWLGVDLADLDPFLLPRRRMEGSFDLDLQLSGSSRYPHLGGSFTVSPARLLQAATGQELGAGQEGRTVNFGAMHGEWELPPGSDQLHLTHLDADWAEGLVEAHGQMALADGSVQLVLDGTGLRLEPLLRDLGVAPTPWVDLELGLQATLSGSFSPLRLEGPYRFDTQGFHVNDGPVSRADSSPVLAIPYGSLEGEILVEPRRVSARVEQLSLPRGQGSGSVSIGLGPQGELDVDLDLRPFDLRQLAPLSDLELAGRGRVSGRIWGPYRTLQAEGTAQVAGLEVLGIPFADEAELAIQAPTMKQLRFTDFQARRGITRYSGNLVVDFVPSLTLDTQVLVHDGRLSDLAGMFLDLPGVEAKVQGTLDLNGDPFHMDGSAELTLNDAEILGERFPSGLASARMRDGIFTLRHLELSRRGESESLLLRGSVGRAYAANFSLLSDGLRLETADALAELGWPLEGGVRVFASMGGSLSEPLFSGQVALTGLRSHDVAVPSSRLDFDSHGSLVQVTGSLVGSSVDLAGQADWSSSEYDFLFDLQRLPLHLAVPLSAAGVPVRAYADGRVTVAGQGGGTPDLDATVHEVSLQWADKSLASDEPWNFTLRGPYWRLDGVRLAGSGSKLNLQGEKFPDRSMVLTGDGELDLEWLRLLGPEILRSDGVARWDLSVAGPARQPEVRLRASLRDGLVRTSWFPHTIEALHGSVAATADGYHVELLQGRLGGGEASFSGRIHARGWLPRAYDLEGRLTDVRVKYLDDLPPIVGDAELAFEGPVDELVLSGSILVDEMLFNERIDWESWVLEVKEERLTAAAPDDSADVFSMDIQVRAPGTGRLRNNVGNAQLSADLRVVGDTARPGVVGEVWTEPDGRVYLQERAFDVTRAELHFIDPYTFDPELDILLESEVRSRVRDYMVYYRVTGPFSDWRTSASSDPPLSQADINWLLVFGATREELEEYGDLQQALAWEGLDLLSNELLSSGEILERLGGDIVDRIDIVTGTTTEGVRNVSSEPRLVVEKDFDAPWDVTVTGEMNVTRPEDLFVSVEKRLARRLFATTYYSSIQYERSLDIGGAWGAEVKLRWEIE